MGRANVKRDYGGVSASDRRDERRRKLAAAGRRLWGGTGLADVTVRGVSSEAGLIPRYFYEHFPDRDALLLSIADEARDELITAMLASGLTAPGSAEDKLRAALKAFLDLLQRDPHLHRIFADVMRGSGILAARKHQALDLVTELVLEHGPALLPGHQVSPATMKRTASYIVGGVNQLVDAWILDPQESTSELSAICTDLTFAVVQATFKTI